MDESSSGHGGGGRTAIGTAPQHPPLAGVTLDREGVQRVLNDTAVKYDLRGCRLDGAHLEGLDFSDCQFGPVPGDATSAGASSYRASAVGTHFNGCRLVGANFRFANLRDAVLEDADVTAANFSRADLTRASIGPIELSDGEFSEAILEHADFCDAQLPGANMSGARLSGADLGGTNLTGADLYTTTLDGTFFGRAILAEANLCDAHGERVLMQGAVLSRAKVSGASLPHVVLRNAQLDKAGLDQSILEDGELAGAYARGASLQRVSLTRADCSGVDFSEARLQRVDLSAANCTGVDFSDAHLHGANLRQADLRRVIFSVDTRLAGATFAGALLHGIQWRGVDLSETDLREAKRIGDEARAKAAPLRDKPEWYRHAAEAYGSLSSALRQCGLARESVAFHYRSALMDQRASKYEFITRLLFLAPHVPSRPEGGAAQRTRTGVPRRIARFLTGPAHLLRWIGSMLLGAVAGYGDAPWRALVSYAVVVTAFAAGYFAVSAPTSQPLGVVGSLVLSLTSFHGRGFNSIDVAIQSPVAEISALEAMLGAFIELLFVAAFTRRFLGARG